MTPEVLRYRVPSEQSEAFVAAYARAAVILRESPECRGVELLRSARDAELFLLLIRWTSAEAHMQGFRRSERFRRFLAEVGPYVPQLLEMGHYAATGVAWVSETAEGPS
jgi:heme-degrading monooxygenase HmoA